MVMRAETTIEALAVIEDDPDVQFFIETIFSMDSRFKFANEAQTAEERPLSQRRRQSRGLW